MGTHPIFESDFDCLTDSMSKEEDNGFLAKLLSTTGVGIQGGTGRIYPRSRLIALLAVIGLICYAAFGGDSDSPRPQVDDGDNFYSVIFDAGSTGSRIHVYTFSRASGKLELLDELFEQVKPGLSSYENDIDGGVDSIRQLLTHAEQTIPSSKWADTPLELKATAGLRLLPEEKANAILDGTRDLLKNSGFKVGDNAVEIMAGNDEGINAWMTVNFLLGSLGGTGLEHTVPTIDLGGGSMQLTFYPKEKITIDSAPSDYIVSKTAFGDSFQLYTHSYLGVGLMSAREALFGGPPEEQGVMTQAESACFPAGSSRTWSNAKHDYTITGSEQSFDQCFAQAQQALAKFNIDKPSEITNGDIFAFSYFFDKAVQSGLIEGDKGGRIKVQQFKDAAESECSKPSDDEWFCTDLSIINALLDAFGLPGDQTLHIANKINGAETQWTLGDSFHLM